VASDEWRVARDSLTEGTERAERIGGWLIIVTTPTRVFWQKRLQAVENNGRECGKERKETTKRLQPNERT